MSSFLCDSSPNDVVFGPFLHSKVAVELKTQRDKSLRLVLKLAFLFSRLFSFSVVFSVAVHFDFPSTQGIKRIKGTMEWKWKYTKKGNFWCTRRVLCISQVMMILRVIQSYLRVLRDIFSWKNTTWRHNFWIRTLETHMSDLSYFILLKIKMLLGIIIIR